VRAAAGLIDHPHRLGNHEQPRIGSRRGHCRLGR
jgi:hypothetical protein